MMFWSYLTALLLISLPSALAPEAIFFVPPEPESFPRRINENNLGVVVTADKALVVEAISGTRLFELAADEAQPIASITKLLTALVILGTEPDWNREIVYEKTDETVGAVAKIKRGEKVSFADAWRAALVASDNNSILAMLRSAGLSAEETATRMNEVARSLGMTTAVFVEPTGLSAGNVASPVEVVKLLTAALARPEIRETVALPEVTVSLLNSGGKRVLRNTDILLDSFLNDRTLGYALLGGKTGFIDEAGYCLAVSVNKDGRLLTAVVLGSEDILARFQDIKALVDWTFANYEFAPL